MRAGEKRPLTTAISLTLIAIGWLFAPREDSAGAPTDSQLDVIDLCAGTCVSKYGESKSQLGGHATHCSQLV